MVEDDYDYDYEYEYEKTPNIPTFNRRPFVYIVAHDEGRNRRNSIGDRNLA